MNETYSRWVLLLFLQIIFCSIRFVFFIKYLISKSKWFRFFKILTKILKCLISKKLLFLLFLNQNLSRGYWNQRTFFRFKCFNIFWCLLIISDKSHFNWFWYWCALVFFKQTALKFTFTAVCLKIVLLGTTFLTRKVFVEDPFQGLKTRVLMS